MRKKRILFVNEASYLSTGYATYGREVMSRMHKTNKYEIAELSVYGAKDDPRAKSLPWKTYPNMPASEEETAQYNSSIINQFGSWRFERVCLDFKPDVVFTIRDHWMDAFIKNSPYRRIFKWLWMPTVDAEPQAQDWIASFSDCDGIFTYSEWAYDLLKKYGLKNVIDFAPPSSSPEFKPYDVAKAKENLGINPEHQIIGTVMRNQRRKLYPSLFEAFAKLTKENDDVYLYCHTGYPDNGWDFGKLLIQNEITSRVYFTYHCQCGYVGAFKFSDVIQQCPNCKNFTLATTSVNAGLSTENLARIYQSFDLYTQPANCEGYGIPCIEAAACGIPVCCTDYSAMKDFIKNLDAYPIKVASFYNELETGCNRAVIDVESLYSIFKEYFELPVELRNIKKKNVRSKFEECSNWDVTTSKWMKFADSVEYAEWGIPPVIKNNPSNIPEFRNNEDLVKWAFTLSSVDDRILNSHDYLSLLKDLNFGIMKKGSSGYFVPESSVFDQENYSPMNPNILLQIVNNRINVNNYWEKVRVGALQLKKENWL